MDFGRSVEVGAGVEDRDGELPKVRNKWKGVNDG
jgi:hypothetical protein